MVSIFPMPEKRFDVVDPKKFETATVTSNI
jgi:hypothetical protein